MRLKHRIEQKIHKLLKEGREYQRKVILGREEYKEFLCDADLQSSWICIVDSKHEWIMGLQITRSRRPRYLCVLPQRRSKKVGFYSTWEIIPYTGTDRACVGLVLDEFPAKPVDIRTKNV